MVVDWKKIERSKLPAGRVCLTKRQMHYHPGIKVVTSEREWYVKDGWGVSSFCQQLDRGWLKIHPLYDWSTDLTKPLLT